ncbi:MAG: anti-sigma factor [Algibacter sp.]|uniref:anti-sigma factor n=1 Tax=Algibacter sp. TaxID=1872428 RepID=UPI0026387BF3|nr:anti-sigma factor [Algibacter sp.]MDG1731280.1 anti-sigma factor [Algibacter sp.]MDG2179853.1 anti-sigma factor [Algibacter sp.]
MIKKMFLALFALGIFTTSCSNDDDNAPANANLTIDLNGLEALGSDYVYEGWIIVNGVPVSTGTFSSVAFPQVFSVEADQLSSATRFVLSIEPSNDPNPAPADTKLLVGDFVGNSASVNTDIVGDFSSAAGAFFLRTPTDETGTNNGNDENGVWFGTPGMPPTPNFVLPTLPAGWAYEGWVVGDNGPITTGTFNAFNTADVFDDFSETSQAGPPVPGEDFFLNAPAGETFPLDVRGRTVVISVEPIPDDSPAPFAIKPLVGTAGQDTAPATYNFGQNLTSLPWGEVNR